MNETDITGTGGGIMGIRPIGRDAGPNGPAEKPEDVKRALAEQALRILGWTKGRANAIDRTILRARLFGHGFTVGDSVMRDAIHRYAPRVCMGPKGYYLPAIEPDGTANQDDVRAAIEYLDVKIRGQIIRRNEIRRAFPEVAIGQLDLDFQNGGK